MNATVMEWIIILVVDGLLAWLIWKWLFKPFSEWLGTQMYNRSKRKERRNSKEEQ
jgi:hypothetical protein